MLILLYSVKFTYFSHKAQVQVQVATATVNFSDLHLLVLGSNGASICTLGLQCQN